MKKNIIFSVNPKDYNENHAGTKAVSDIEIYLKEVGFRTINLCNRLDNKLNKVKDIIFNYKKIISNIEEKTLVVYQYPMLGGKLDILITNLYAKAIRSKGGKNIVVIHDLDSLRYYISSKEDNYIKKEINTLNKYDYIISHNSEMSKWLRENGLISKIVDLELFDYKSENKYGIDYKDKEKNSIAFAGNLNKIKSGFIYKLNDVLLDNISISLYGPNYSDENANKRITYKGVFKPEELGSVINETFGLIWDGDSIETCSGEIGEYTKYNNPHKLSLYISCGLPVIVWNKSAISKFVNKNNIGIVINSISEIHDKISNLDKSNYIQMLKNCEKIRNKVTDGYFIKRAISKIEKDIREVEGI